MTPALRPALLALALLFGSQAAWSHPFGISSFRAQTVGPDVFVAFILDGESVRDMVQRSLPSGAPQREPSAPYVSALLGYLDERFTVTRGEHTCTRDAPTRVAFAERLNRTLMDVTYRCPTEDDILELHSELFLDEMIPHHVVGIVTHRQAVEKYFFTGGERRARIQLNQLRQRETRSLPGNPKGGVRIASPPKGAFAAVGPDAPHAPKRAHEGENLATDATPAMGSGFKRFFVEGVHHIFLGIDHILFVLSLLLVTRTWRDLALVITGFTVAHSITLGLGAFSVVALPGRFVEPVIALSIVYVAVENVVRAEPKRRLLITFAFGLIHGFGFSSQLTALGLTAGELWPALLGFNLGVEAGQLLMVLPLFPALLALQRKPSWYRPLMVGTSACVALVAVGWFVERLLA